MSIFSTNVVTPSFNSPLLMGCPSSNCALTDHTENVICNHPQFEYQCIGCELSGWKPLQIHVSFYLTMKLLTFSMGMIQTDDSAIRDAGYQVDDLVSINDIPCVSYRVEDGDCCAIMFFHPTNPQYIFCVTATQYTANVDMICSILTSLSLTS